MGARIPRGPFRTGGFYGLNNGRSMVERKVIDFPDAVYTINTTSNGFLMNGVGTGTDFNQRIGRRINVTSIQLRGYFDLNQTTSTDIDACRMMIVQDCQPNGVTPNLSDVLTVDPTSGLVHPNAFMNLNNRERFKVIWDKLISLGCYERNVGNIFYNAKPYIDVYKRVNIPVEFSATGNTIGSIATNSILFFIFGSAGTATWKFSTNARLRFTDA